MEERKIRGLKLKIWSAIIFFVVAIGLAFFLFSGGTLEIIKGIFRDDISNEEVRDALFAFRIKGYITIGILSNLQVVLTVLPAEPVQVVAGLTFGFLWGGLACIVGVFIGNTLIYILYKVYGQRLTRWFESNAEFDFEVAKHSSKIAFIILLLYFLPAIPYGLICFFTASLGIKYPKYILLTTLGAIPSVAIGVALGHMAVSASWIISVCVFVVIIALLIVLYLNKAKLFKKLNDYVKRQNADTIVVQKCNKFVLNSADFVSKIALGRKVKVKLENKVGRLERPSIVLSTHGSFLDFVYSGRIIKKERPHFVVARLYFYHKILGKLLKSIGAFPKSMFSSDIENVKNCMTVISKGEVLAMMPEARLSTVGKFEGIQDSTFKFIKKMGVPVYYIKLEGDYFAKPKWGDKARKGSVVHATLDKLFTKEEIQNATLEQVAKKIETALYYDEFEWLESMPNVHYKSKTLAKGLENILTTCPNCKAKYSIETSGMMVTCKNCNLTATLDDRYGFIDEKPFKNFAEWYEWQKAEMQSEIINGDFKLTQEVTLKHSSKNGKGCTQVAGHGVCTLDKTGLKYVGDKDGEQIEKFFKIEDIYRLLFGAGEDFEIYEGKEIWYFVPNEKRSCVDFYTASELLEKLRNN